MRRILHGDFGSGPFGAWDLLDKLGDEFDRLGAFKPNSPLYDSTVRFLSHSGEVLRPIQSSMNQFKERFQVQGGIDMEGGNGEFASRVTTPRPGAAGFRDAEGIPAKKPTANPQEVSTTTGAVTQGGGKAAAAANTKAPSHGAGYNDLQAVAGEKAGAGGGAANSAGLTGRGLWVDAREIRWSQESVSYAKSANAYRIKYDLDSMATQFKTYAEAIPAIDVVRMPDGRLTALDNSRLTVRADQGGSIKANIFSYDEIIADPKYATRFVSEGVTPETYGQAVLNRIMEQRSAFSSVYPYGSPLPPKVNGAPSGSYWTKYSDFPWLRK
jgi:hypothetical protein